MSRAVPWPVFCLAPLPGRRRLGMPSSRGTRKNRESNLRYLTNNMRFLILPWVRVPHLASHILSRIAHRHQSTDWQKRSMDIPSICSKPLSTAPCSGASVIRRPTGFSPARPEGRTRNDRNHDYPELPVKDIYVYPLHQRIFAGGSVPHELSSKRDCQETGPKRKSPIREEEIQGFKYYLILFFKILNPFHNVKTHQNRKLFYDQYLALILLYFFNPVLTSLRGIQQVTSLEKVQKRLGIKKTSLSSLSEASYVFDPKLLQPLLERTGRSGHLPRRMIPKLKKIYQIIKAVYGTLFPALPQILWALCGKMRKPGHQARPADLTSSNRFPTAGPSSLTATAMKRKSSKPSSPRIPSISSMSATQNINS